jgi:hypothetical protein
MHDAVETADELLARFRDVDVEELEEIDLEGAVVVGKEGWRRIEAAEVERGRRLGKVREKIGEVEEMLEVACRK